MPSDFFERDLKPWRNNKAENSLKDSPRNLWAILLKTILRDQKKKFARSEVMCRGILLYKFGRILPAILWEVFFSGHFSPWEYKIWRQNPQIRRQTLRKIQQLESKHPQKNLFCQQPALTYLLCRSLGSTIVSSSCASPQSIYPPPRRNDNQNIPITILFGKCPGALTKKFLREPRK